MIRRPPRSTLDRSSAASDVYKRQAMRNALKRIQTGEYAKMFIQEGKTNYPSMTARRRLNAVHPIETVGGQLRDMMPWIKKNKLVDQSKN